MRIGNLEQLDTESLKIAVAPPSMVVELFGPLRLRQGSRVIERFRTQKVAGLLAYLSYFRDRMHSRERLAELFWPKSSLENAKASLAVALSSLRSQLEPSGVPHNVFLLTTATMAGISSENVSTDVAQFEQLIERAETEPSTHETIVRLREAIALYQPELLSGMGESWIAAEQDRLQGKYALATHRLARLLDEAGQRDEGLHWLRESVTTRPTDPETMLLLFHWWIEREQTVEAIAFYHELVGCLRDEWDKKPPVEVVELMEPLLASKLRKPPPTSDGVVTYPLRPTSGPRTGSVTVAPPVTQRETVARTAPTAKTTPLPLSGEQPLESARSPVVREGGRDGYTPAIAGESDLSKRRGRPRSALLDVQRGPQSYSQERASEDTETIAGFAESAPASFLPLPITRFFGREQELRRLEALFSDPYTRLVTITGPGGSGKTRLALRFAELYRDQLERVLFIGMVEARDAAAFCETIAKHIGIEATTREEILVEVSSSFRGVSTLLILDNLEQLADTEVPLHILELLQRVPELTVLVTSRRRLPIQGECELPLLPLPLPEDDVAGEEIEAALQENPALALFVDRAQKAVPDFRVTTKNAVAIVELVRRLEGIPLAIELAAARLQTVTPAQMLQQLSHRLDLLVSRRPMFSERHRSLRETIAWSYQLLEPELQRFFSRLGVMRGGWTAEDASALTGEPLTIEFLEQLVDASLVQRETRMDSVCFYLLETLREFAEEQLQPKVRANLEERHAHYFLEVARNEKRRMDGAEQVTAIARLTTAHENCCAAMDWSLRNSGREALETGARTAAALVRFWRLCGWQQRGKNYLTALRNRLEWEQLPPLLRTAVINGLGIMWLAERRYDLAKPLFEECLELCRKIHQPACTAAALNNLALIAHETGDLETARRYFEESLDYWRTSGDWHTLATTLKNLGDTVFSLGDSELGYAYAEEALRIARSEGDHEIEGLVLDNLGRFRLSTTRYSEAELLFHKSILAFHEIPSWSRIALALIGAGICAERHSRWEEADEWLQCSLTYCVRQKLLLPQTLREKLPTRWKDFSPQQLPSVRKLEEQMERIVLEFHLEKSNAFSLR